MKTTADDIRQAGRNLIKAKLLLQDHRDVVCIDAILKDIQRDINKLKLIVK